jgi:hypothetical protein
MDHAVAVASDATLIGGDGDPFTTGAAWVQSEAPWEPAELVSVEGAREGPLGGGATITLRGHNFAPSEWLSCVFGSLRRAVQVDPMKPMLNLPGTERLKLNCDIPLSTSASNSFCAATPRAGDGSRLHVSLPAGGGAAVRGSHGAARDAAPG